ncbi:MAG: PKD domain-containing protein [Methanoregula sp.]|nr:PKD domain-containing protein [Methanoregula sp.]
MKKKIIYLSIGVLLIILIAAGFIFHILPGPATMGNYFLPKAGPQPLHPLADTADLLQIRLNSPMFAGFVSSPEYEYTPLTLRFLDLSRGTPASWQWDFGDGTRSTLQSPVHTFQKDGIYNVTLEVTRPDGSRRKVSHNDILGITRPQEQAVLIDTLREGIVQKGSSVVFQSSGSSSYCTMNGAKISFANDSVVKLRIDDNQAGTVTIRQGNLLSFSFPSSTLQVNGQQVAHGISGECSLPEVRHFSAHLTLSVIPTKGELRQVVVNGQKIRAGAENSQIQVVHDSRNKNADLTLVSYPAYFEGSAVNFSLSSALIADFDPSSTLEGLAPLNVTFRDLSAGSPGSWSWDFGDGSRSTEQNPTHTYQTPGSYTVSLSVNRGEQSDTIIRKNAIIAAPPRLEADFSALPTKGIVPLVVKFSDHSTGSPWTWQWDFGNITPPGSSEQNPVVTFSKPGTYNIRLAVANIYGSSDLMRARYITVIDPYRIPDRSLFVKSGKTGYVKKDSSIQFEVSDGPASIGLNGGYRELAKGALVRLEAQSDQKGEIYLEKGQLLKFSFPDMALYIDGELVSEGAISTIYVPRMTGFQTAITYYLVPDSAYTQVTENGYQVLGDWDNAWIQVENLGMNAGGSLRLISSDDSTYIDGAVNQTIHDWVIG